MGHERVDLLGLIDGTDVVVPPDGDERRALDPAELGTAVVGRVLLLNDEVAHGDAMARVRSRHEARSRQALVEEIERANGLERAPEALVVRERAIPERAIGGPLRGRRGATGIVLGARHEVAAGGCPDDCERPDRARIPCRVHQAEEAAPADPENIDPLEAERSPHALDVVDELVLRALLDWLPRRASVPAVIVEDEVGPERRGQRSEDLDEP